MMLAHLGMLQLLQVITPIFGDQFQNVSLLQEGMMCGLRISGAFSWDVEYRDLTQFGYVEL